MFLRCLFAVATFALCTAAAHADTFVLNANFLAPEPFEISHEDVTGTITIDTTTGMVTATDLTLTLYADNLEGFPPVVVASEELGGAGFNMEQGAYTYSGSLGLPPITYPSPTTYYQLDIFNSVSSNSLILNFQNASLVGYSGGGLCTNITPCPTYFGGVPSSVTWSFDGQSGTSNMAGELPFSLEPAAVPEPSTFTLVGSGLIGLAGAFRGRRVARHAPKPTT